MKTPRDVSGKNLIKLPKRFGYEAVSQNGSHIKVTTEQNGYHHIAVPNHDPVKVSTLNGILSEVARHAGVMKEEVAQTLFG